MSRTHAALSVSELPQTPDDIDDDFSDREPPTKRFGALDLAGALAAMAFPDNDDDETTLTISPEVNRRYVASAFQNHASRGPVTDDDPTVRTLAPAIPFPPGIPSPLGDAPRTDLGESGVHRRIVVDTAPESELGDEPQRAAHPTQPRWLAIASWTVSLVVGACLTAAIVNAEASNPYERPTTHSVDVR